MNPMTADYLEHHGVIGMKWGVRRYQNKDGSLTPAGQKRITKIENKNEKREKRAVTMDRKSASSKKLAEKRHAKYDLNRSNRIAVKSAQYAKKSAKLEKTALKTTDPYKADKLRDKAANLNYKSNKIRAKADRLSLSKGYGPKAMRFAIKSDRYAAKAAYARKRIANDTRYINLLKRPTPRGDSLVSRGISYLENRRKHMNKANLVAESRIISEMNTARLKNKKLNDAWSKAHDAGEGSKEWLYAEKIQDEFLKPYQKRINDLYK